MRPIKDHVIIRADKDKKSTFKLKLSGLVLYKDTSFNPYDKENVTQDGIVLFVPDKLSGGKKIDITPGDHVLTHHFLCDKENEIIVDGEILYKIQYEDIYCKIVTLPDESQQVEMIGDWNFLSPLDEDLIKTTLIVPDSCKKKSSQRAVAFATSSKMAEGGIKTGDTVFFDKNMDYEIDVFGKTLYRIKDNYLLATLF